LFHSDCDASASAQLTGVGNGQFLGIEAVDDGGIGVGADGVGSSAASWRPCCTSACCIPENEHGDLVCWVINCRNGVVILDVLEDEIGSSVQELVV